MFQDERAKIEFNVPYTQDTFIDKDIEFEVYEFIDPKSKLINRFEFSATKVNLIAGVSTLLFELNQKIANEYTIYDGKNKFKAYLHTHLTSLNITEKHKSFSYTLFDGERKMGNITISLEILD
ncbi:hypothetical protein [Mycoplasma phocimorsus]|uniref:Uncharacterized protein n=2 Tax=Mycoplasma phocimorsus TaxID=3045839 RepID=A0AAJ1PS26_9MOLU|nr:hypothetical protein [Mycoplasma phocimorsus]MDJ1645506.1 hypothetical protein [Mycoplasma phocimorsus]MDJ1646446.1 hypothetical protein [Mycoplasma phocimorsus]MDJ1646990.1 hypothetical protein [Mycoplasma phocimorsus]MDJ1647437.1 hypothetical protein [Mycoplasma phocimorsus]MDJ1647948.1 hypothetical protein [Mycoplasma phocimorsus]